MAKDFDPQKTTVQVDQWTGQRVREVFNPATGGKIFVAYIEGDNPAIPNMLTQIENLSDNFRKLSWDVTAEPDCKASVDVRVTVRTDA